MNWSKVVKKSRTKLKSRRLWRFDELLNQEVLQFSIFTLCWLNNDMMESVCFCTHEVIRLESFFFNPLKTRSLVWSPHGRTEGVESEKIISRWRYSPVWIQERFVSPTLVPVVSTWQADITTCMSQDQNRCWSSPSLPKQLVLSRNFIQVKQQVCIMNKTAAGLNKTSELMGPMKLVFSWLWFSAVSNFFFYILNVLFHAHVHPKVA